MKILRIVVLTVLVLSFISSPVAADDVEYLVEGKENVEDNYVIKDKIEFNEKNYYVVVVNDTNLETPINTLSTKEYMIRNNIVNLHERSGKIMKTLNPTNNIELINASGFPLDENYNGINIAVIDTGISEHNDLDSVEWEINTVGGNVTEKETTDNYGHGTHVAGIIGANYNRSSDVRGVAPSVDIYDIKSISDEGTGRVSDLATGIRKAAEGPDGIRGTEDDADVISMSFGLGDTNFELIEDIIEDIHPEIVTVASAGNRGIIEYPARYEETISVANIAKLTDQERKRLGRNYLIVPGPTSAVGEENTVAAPGYLIKSLSNDNSFSLKTGTSMSAPHVSGALGLYLSRYNTNAEITTKILEKTSTDVVEEGFDKRTGHGLLNVEKLLSTSPKPKIKNISTQEKNKKIKVSFNIIKYNTETNVFRSVSISNKSLKQKDYNKIECCKFSIKKDNFNINNKERLEIKIKAKNNWGSTLEKITHNLKDSKTVLEAIKESGDNKNIIERESIQKAIFNFVETEEKLFNGREMTREGIQNAIFEYNT